MKIFISYRSTDFDRASSLRGQLAEAIGDNFLTFDKHSFASGAEWLPQIYTGVAMCDILLCAIGPGWVLEGFDSKEGRIDYMREELELARRLGKPVLPLLMGVSADQVSGRLPPDFHWLSSLHFCTHDPQKELLSQSLLREISNLGGPKALRTDSREYWRPILDFAELLGQLGGSLVRPTSHAASALRPIASGVQIGALKLTLVLALMTIPAQLVGGEISFGILVWFLAVGLLLAVVTYASAFTIVLCARKKFSAIGLTGFSLHVSATYLMACFVWAMVAWAIAPSDVLTRLINLPDDGRLPLQQIEAYISAMSFGTLVIFRILNAALLLHLLYLTFAHSRAITLSLGWTLRRQALAMSGLVALGCFLAIPFVVQVESWRKSDLPRTVRMTWLADRITSGGKSEGAPVSFVLDGNINNQGREIVFSIAKFSAENRNPSKIELKNLNCSLGILESGDFKWPQRVPNGKIPINTELNHGDRFVVVEKSLSLPITEETKSGTTILQCYVDTVNATYLLGTGKTEVLTW